eukprot:COSAG02_NODE_2463_length_8788_cov_3.119001_6_plen_554_part_00
MEPEPEPEPEPEEAATPDRTATARNKPRWVPDADSERCTPCDPKGADGGRASTSGALQVEEEEPEPAARKRTSMPGIERSGRVEQPGRVVGSPSRIHTREAFHLSPVEKGKREQCAVLRQIQEVMKSQQRKLNGLQISDSQTAFAAMDRDDSGTLDRGEVATAIRRLGLGLEESQIESLMRSLDREGNGTVDYEAWLDYMLTDFSDMPAQTRLDEPRRAILSCKRELRNLSLHSLMLLAKSTGVEDQEVQRVNWRPELEGLIQRKLGDLRHELERMSLRQVQTKAEEFGIPKLRLEAAEEHPVPKLALIDLMIMHELQRAPQRMQDHEKHMEQRLLMAEQAEAKAKEQAAQALQLMQDHEKHMEQRLLVAEQAEAKAKEQAAQALQRMQDHEKDMEQRLLVAEQAEAKAKEQAAQALQRMQDNEKDMEQRLLVAEQAEAKAKEQAAQALQRMQDHEKDMEQQLLTAARVESDLESIFLLQQRVSTLEVDRSQQVSEAWNSDGFDDDGVDLTEKLQGTAEEGTPPLDMFERTEDARDTQLNALQAVMELMSPPK